MEPLAKRSVTRAFSLLQGRVEPPPRVPRWIGTTVGASDHMHAVLYAPDPGALEGQASTVLDVTGASGDKLTGLRDLGTPNPPPLDVTFSVTELPTSHDTQHWLLTATVKGLTDVMTQKRFLSFSVGQQFVTLPYTLTNRLTQEFAWSVKAPTTEISLRPGQGIEIGVSVGPVPATGVGLSQAVFVEQTTKTLVGDGWELCDSLSDCKDHTFSIPANSQKRLWLRPKGGTEVVGKYSGAIVIGVAQKRDGETATMSISGTSACRQWLGAGAILLGVLFAWTVTGYLQTQLNRAQLLRPAVVLMEQVDETHNRLKLCPPTLIQQTSQTSAALHTLAGNLSERALQTSNLLPGKIPNPYVAWAPDPDNYKAYMARQTLKLAWLDLLVTQGFEKLWAKVPAAPADVLLTAARQSSEALDALSGRDAPPQPDPLADIRGVVGAFPPAALAPPAAPPAAPVAPALSYQRLTVEIASISLLTWVLFAVLATALGTPDEFWQALAETEAFLEPTTATPAERALTAADAPCEGVGRARSCNNRKKSAVHRVDDMDPTHSQRTSRRGGFRQDDRNLFRPARRFAATGAFRNDGGASGAWGQRPDRQNAAPVHRRGLLSSAGPRDGEIQNDRLRDDGSSSAPSDRSRQHRR
jgi:hypothetical protein